MYHTCNWWHIARDNRVVLLTGVNLWYRIHISSVVGQHVTILLINIKSGYFESGKNTFGGWLSNTVTDQSNDNPGWNQTGVISIDMNRFNTKKMMNNFIINNTIWVILLFKLSKQCYCPVGVVKLVELIIHKSLQLSM